MGKYSWNNFMIFFNYTTFSFDRDVSPVYGIYKREQFQNTKLFPPFM